MAGRIPGIIFFCSVVITMSCSKKTENIETTFTKGDSLTDFYLSLQDSMLRSWNIMINDDNQKVTAMHHLLHELMVSSSGADVEFKTYENQLTQLTELRYSRASLSEPDVVEEYDFASNVLVSELISRAESSPDFVYNRKMQELVDQIRIADQRVNLFREEYDAVTSRYNAFIQENQTYLIDFTWADSLDVKPLFQMTSTD
jgi:hypothetical protein